MGFGYTEINICLLRAGKRARNFFFFFLVVCVSEQFFFSLEKRVCVFLRLLSTTFFFGFGFPVLKSGPGGVRGDNGMAAVGWLTRGG